MLILTGTREGKPFRMEVDLPALFEPGGRDKDIVIQNGDVLWVQRQPQVYIYGEVQRPGQIRLERGMTLLQTLASGGGLTQRGTEKGIRAAPPAARRQREHRHARHGRPRAGRRRGVRQGKPVLSDRPVSVFFTTDRSGALAAQP
jgi:protein involved in polysaccharide export with SLBB domain